MKMWIARDMDGLLYLYDNIPEKYSEFFASYTGYNEIRLDDKMFPEVTLKIVRKKLKLI